MARSTYLQKRWPDTPVFQDIAQNWCADHSRRLLDLVWRGYDLLRENDLAKVPHSAEDEAREESINFLLALRIDQCKCGDEPFSVSHQPPEQARRKKGRGRSPQPDIAFVPYEYPRSLWPMEGKVLKQESDLDAYLAEIRDNFLTGRYATFSREGAMLGYLLEGEPDRTLGNIGVRLRTSLRSHPDFQERPHRVSVHQRIPYPGTQRQNTFCCHHLILLVGTSRA